MPPSRTQAFAVAQRGLLRAPCQAQELTLLYPGARSHLSGATGGRVGGAVGNKLEPLVLRGRTRPL